jgi:hypothetical protein
VIHWQLGGGPSPTLKLLDAPPADITYAEQALVRFRDSGHPNAATTGQRMLDAIRSRAIPWDTLVSMSRWCHTEGTYRSGREPAEEASRALFSGVIPNLAANQRRQALPAGEGRARATDFFLSAPATVATTPPKTSVSPQRAASGRTGPASKGSRYCLQQHLEFRRAQLDEAILANSASMGIEGAKALIWKSPLPEADYYECRDDFLVALDLGKHAPALGEFWPSGGPQWDGLATVVGHQPGVLLVEAKAHLAETASKCTAGDESRERIHRAFRTVQHACGIARSDWTRDEVYQLGNRLAYLWFLNEKLGIPTWLALVLFVEDTSYRPTRRAQWEPHIAGLLRSMGVTGTTLADRIAVVYVPA